MVGCCVPRCGKNSSKPCKDDRFRNMDRKVTYHQFPSCETTRCLWVKAVHDGGRVESWGPTANTKICSLHFNIEDIQVNQKGTVIKKGAVPVIQVTDQKKKPRRNKADREIELRDMILEAVGDDLENVPCNFDVPSTSSGGMYTMEVSMEVDDVPPPVSKKVVMNSPMETFTEYNVQTKKVVKMADNHTFEAPQGATYEDPCLSMYGEMMDLMKKFNQLMTVHHPEKAHKVGDLMNQAASIFSPEETDMPPKQKTTLSQDPFMGIGSFPLEDYAAANGAWTQEVNEFVMASVSELEYSEVLNDPEKFLNL